VPPTSTFNWNPSDIPDFTSLRFIPDIADADVIRIVQGEQHVQRAFQERVNLLYWRISDISTSSQRAWQGYAVALSASQSGQQYTVRFGVTRSQRGAFSLLDMPLHRKKTVSRCNCLAGEQGRSA
jgi:hypothetical protein